MDNNNKRLQLLQEIATKEYFGVRMGCVVNGVVTYSTKLDSYWSEFNHACIRRNIVERLFNNKELAYIDVVVISGKDMPSEDIHKLDLVDLFITRQTTNSEAMLHFARFLSEVSKTNRLSVSTEINRLKMQMVIGNGNKKQDKKNENAE